MTRARDEIGSTTDAHDLIPDQIPVWKKPEWC